MEVNLTLEQQVLLQVFLLGRRIRKKMKHADPNKMLNHAILLLVSQKNHTVSTLAETLAISLSTASEKINKLNQAGLLSLSSLKDKRFRRLALTSLGKQKLAEVNRHFARQAKLVLEGIDSSQQQIFIRSLQQLQINLQQSEVQHEI